MKRLFVTLAMILVSSAAFADQSISLSAGSTVRLAVGLPTLVTCQGSQNTSATTSGICKMTKTQYAGYFDVSIGETVIQNQVSGFDATLEVIKKLRDAGLCN